MKFHKIAFASKNAYSNPNTFTSYYKSRAKVHFSRSFPPLIGTNNKIPITPFETDCTSEVA